MSATTATAIPGDIRRHIEARIAAAEPSPAMGSAVRNDEWSRADALFQDMIGAVVPAE